MKIIHVINYAPKDLLLPLCILATDINNMAAPMLHVNIDH